MTRRTVKLWAGQPVNALRRRWDREDVHLYGNIDSTNDAARALADAGAPAGTIVLARGQSAGRGRGGSEWQSPEGAGVYLSMLFRPETDAVPGLVGILAGIDASIALGGLGPELAPRVKWPNDIMARDRKLGGVLAEASRDGAGAAQLIVGVGVNVFADGLPGRLDGAIAVDECVPEPALPEVADALVRGLERRLHAPPESLDEAALDELDRLDWLRNRRVRHELPEAEPLEGIAAGIAPDGALLLRPDRGALRRVVAGSVRVLE